MNVTAPDGGRELASLPLDSVLARLGADPAVGLTEAEVARRLSTTGYNEVPPRRTHPALALARKFTGISAWMLELIMLLSLLQRRWPELLVVSGLLVANALINFALERRAAGVVEALRQRLQVAARVRRDGDWRPLPARELVPGDVVRLRAGDVVPADVRLLAGALALDQSALTGESGDVSHAVGDLLPAASRVRKGEGDGLVVLTGAATYFGRTAELVQLARPTLQVERVIARVVRWLLLIVGTLVAAVLVAALLVHAPLLELLPLALVLLMSAIPVALPVMFTVSMALGSAELARRGVLVTRLSASEDAATMDVLCVDKTGTLTVNALTITGVLPADGHTEAEVLLAGARASEAADQDPIDQAFLAAARESAPADGSARRVAFVPFDPARRRTEAVVELDGQSVRAIKGAVPEVATACGLSPAAVAELERRAADAAAGGARVLAVAGGPAEAAPSLRGLVVLRDPPRPDAPELVAALRAQGVRLLMLTGDALPVARAVGAELGLPRIEPVAALEQAATPGGGLAADVDGFAEVYPEDKFRVVQALQRAGHVVGMTGDGVNDAPALRQAEVGIAVAGATDVARGAASVVLTDPGLGNIVALVEQGRVIYQRILSWIINKVSRTLFSATFVAVVFLATGRFVISALAMLLYVFIMDFSKIALGTDRVWPSQQPETWVLRRYIVAGAAVGGLMVIEALAALAFAWSRFGLAANAGALATFSFQVLLFTAVFSLVSARERRAFWSSWPSRTLGLALTADVLLGLILPWLPHSPLQPLPWAQSTLLLAYAALVCLGVNDAVKVRVLRWGTDGGERGGAPTRPAPGGRR